jgi:hypothetical protein
LERLAELAKQLQQKKEERAELDTLLGDDSSLAEMVVQEKRQCDQELRDIEVHIVVLSLLSKILLQSFCMG